MHVYRLFGFSGVLSLSPTVFQDPLPSTRICSLCGVVPERTSLLPCGHVLCQFCLDGMVSEGSVCPVDGEEFLGQETPRLDFTGEQIAKCEAHCWNIENGCDFVGPVTSLLEHYNAECVFHGVPCSRCKRPVLRRHFAEHWAAGCASLIAEQREAQEPRWIADVTKALEKVSSENIILQTTFNELLEGIRSENASVRHTVSSEVLRLSERYDEKAACILEKQDQLQRMIDDMKVGIKDPLSNEINSVSDKITTFSKYADSIKRNILSRQSFHWYLHNWSKLRADVLQRTAVVVESDPTYVQGYNIFLKAKLGKIMSTLEFGLWLRVTKGEWDSTLEWPFRKRFTLSIVHLDGPSKSISYTINLSNMSAHCWIPMPGTSDVTGCSWPLTCRADAIETHGLVTDDTVHLCVEIHS